MTHQQPPTTPKKPIDCESAQEWIITALDADALGDVPDAEVLSTDIQTALDAHLADCQMCRVYRQNMQRLLSTVCDLEEVPVPNGLVDRIMLRIEQDTAQTADVRSASVPGAFRPGRPVMWKRYAPLAAAFLLIAVAVPMARQWMEAPRNAETTQQTVAQQGMLPQNTLSSVASDGPSDSRPRPKDISDDNKPGTVRPAPTIRTAIAVHRSEQAPVGGAGNQPVDVAQMASPIVEPTDSTLVASVPQSPAQYLDSTYASDEHGDVYYDPVSTLVGF